MAERDDGAAPRAREAVAGHRLHHVSMIGGKTLFCAGREVVANLLARYATPTIRLMTAYFIFAASTRITANRAKRCSSGPARRAPRKGDGVKIAGTPDRRRGKSVEGVCELGPRERSRAGDPHGLRDRERRGNATSVCALAVAA